MKFITFAFFALFQIILGQAPVAPVAAPGVAPVAPAAVPVADPNAVQPVSPVAQAQPIAPVTGSANPAVDLMTCSLPHTFTPAEIGNMNQVLTVLLLVLQVMLFLNTDKSQEQATYTALLPIYREATKLLQNIK